MRERFVRRGFTSAVMDLNPKSAWTIAALALAGGALLLGGSSPWSGRNAGFDGAALAARAPGTPARQGKAPKPAEVDHPPVAPESKAEAENLVGCGDHRRPRGVRAAAGA